MEDPLCDSSFGSMVTLVYVTPDTDNTTQLLWKTIPTKLHLQKGDDGRRTGTLFLIKKERQGPIRQRPDFRKAKQAHRQLFKEHAESTGEAINSHPAHQQDKIIGNT